VFCKTLKRAQISAEVCVSINQWAKCLAFKKQMWPVLVILHETQPGKQLQTAANVVLETP